MRVWCISGLAVALSACGQLQTSSTEKAGLEAAAANAQQAYISCIVEASDRYQQTGEDAALIAQVSMKACTGARSAYVDAENAHLKSRYMATEPILDKELAATEEKATALVEERVLERKATAPTSAAAPLVAASAAAAPPAGNDYLDCMGGQGQRYAAVDESAEIIAEVAHSRCAALLTDPASAAPLERQGRALVMGMVLDRKASKP